jgi:hypothetical protein
VRKGPAQSPAAAPLAVTHTSGTLPFTGLQLTIAVGPAGRRVPAPPRGTGGIRLLTPSQNSPDTTGAGPRARRLHL